MPCDLIYPQDSRIQEAPDAYTEIPARHEALDEGLLPQAAVISAVTRQSVTRQYSHMPANFAAHPPENANTTEPRVLRASNGPDPQISPFWMLADFAIV